MNYHELVPLPARGDINTGLSAAKQSTMLRLFGKPGRLTQDCSAVTNTTLQKQIRSASVGPFLVEGWGPAVDCLRALFLEVKAKDPALYAVVRTAGMLCCRAVRGSDSSYSNHSWGTAIDLKIETQIDEMGAKQVQRGILALYPYFHAHGWFWAAGYSTRPDPMHFEISDEKIQAMVKAQGV